MAFVNRVRLAFELKKAQFPEERKDFRKANGVTKTLSVIVRKTYQGSTDFWPELWHQRFKIALAHDNIRVEGDRYLGDIAQDGDYSINWPDFLDFPTAPAEFKVNVTPFDATNSNCQTCEEASQLTLTDDQATGIYGALQEGTDYTVEAADNDTICCFPAVFSLTSFNSDYLTSASINATGLLSFHTGTGLTEVNGLLIATYRVTCPNGNYDEANVYADISGSVAGCLAPTDLAAVTAGPDYIQFSWVEPFNDASYEWEIYAGSSPVGSPVQTGLVDITEGTTVTGLDPAATYYFQVRTVCASANSIWVGIIKKTAPESDICGEYNVFFNNGSGIPADSSVVRYRDCNGDIQATVVYNNSAVLVCALQTSPGSPVYITGTAGGSGLTITYIGLC